MDLDLVDIALHAGIAFAAVFVACLFGPPVWLALALTVVNAGFWWSREAWQGRRKYGTWRFAWSRQKIAEAVAPTITGTLAFVVYLVAMSHNGARIH